MSEVLVVEFTGVTVDDYQAVNKILSVDQDTGQGNWPEGLHSHLAATSGNGLIIVESWESQAAQAAFMESRLGPAIGEAGVPQPTRMEWMTLAGEFHD
ncbi:MAG TPA: hypothetical protein VJ851_05600 [Jatrophihabitans sp.]|nr:hypothetical protein [Jatrophihabitans sp.]